MAFTAKKLLIVADDHPRVREAVESIIAELHGSVTLYSADHPRELLPLAEKRVAEAAELTVIDISTKSQASACREGPRRELDEPAAAGAPLMVVSAQEGGITAHWFAAIEANDDGDEGSTIQAAFDQRTVVLDLILSLRDASQQPGAAAHEALDDLPGIDSLMQLGLTQRQAEVLLSLAEGLTNKEIARRLQVSEWTVRHHVSAILERLEVSNRGRAAMFARRLGGA